MALPGQIVHQRCGQTLQCLIQPVADSGTVIGSPLLSGPHAGAGGLAACAVHQLALTVAVQRQRDGPAHRAGHERVSVAGGGGCACCHAFARLTLKLLHQQTRARSGRQCGGEQAAFARHADDSVGSDCIHRSPPDGTDGRCGPHRSWRHSRPAPMGRRRRRSPPARHARVVADLGDDQHRVRCSHAVGRSEELTRLCRPGRHGHVKTSCARAAAREIGAAGKSRRRRQAQPGCDVLGPHRPVDEPPHRVVREVGDVGVAAD